MSGVSHLRSLAQGQLPANDGLLGNTRCAWGGVDLLSQEAIVAAFAAQPFDLEGEVHTVETAQGAALIGAEEALYADLYDGRIGRLWRIGSVPALAPEPAIDVAFDADMRQERGDLSFCAEDHPCLDTDATERLTATARGLLDGLRHEGHLRVRVFVVRAAGNSTASAALIALFTLSNQTSRAASFGYAALGLGTGEDSVRWITDPVRTKPWTPRL